MTRDYCIPYHEYMKVGYGITTTKDVDWYEYLSFVIDFTKYVYGRYYDIDRRHHEGLSYYDLPDALLDLLIWDYQQAN